MRVLLLAAQGEVQDYLWTIALTLGRMSEINRLEWKDVDFDKRIVTLYMSTDSIFDADFAKTRTQ